MRLSLFKKAMNAFENRVRERQLNRFHSFERIKELLEAERARSERTGHDFSLVVFGTTVDKADIRTIGQLNLDILGPTLLKRARSTDHLGHFSDSRICVILPDTPASGADAFAQSVIATLKDSMSTTAIVSLVPFQVFVFPFPPSGNDGDGNHGESNGNGDRRGRAGSDRRGRLPDAGGVIARQDCGPSLNDADRTDQQIFEVRSLDELLARPLPLWKRAIDIAGASLAILLAWPVMLVAATLIKLTSPGAIFFKQRRCGLGGKPFHILKFRTMVVDAERLQANLMKMNEQDGPAFKISNDPRITPIGKFLRKTSLDELPQLINVLRGEMSLVGPRPLPVKEQHACNSWQRRRLDVTPGLTCIWQVSGRGTVSFDKWIRMDLHYIRRRTPIHDLKILMQTVPTVVFSRGAR
jgi:lipopolysaccharide/colanic/teichoic acid biosynthesis glycosyltransferase